MPPPTFEAMDERLDETNPPDENTGERYEIQTDISLSPFRPDNGQSEDNNDASQHDEITHTGPKSNVGPKPGLNVVQP